LRVPSGLRRDGPEQLASIEEPAVIAKILAHLERTAPDPYRLWTARCAARHPIAQLKAVFEKELQDKPDSWHAPAAYIARGKIYEMCKKK